MRENVDAYCSPICNHIGIGSFGIKAPLRRAPQPSTEAFVPCRDVLEYCAQCVTDYTTTVERRTSEQRAGLFWRRRRQSSYWVITITSYHRLGSGLSSSDFYWQAFAKHDVWPLGAILRSLQGDAFVSGPVKAVWEEGVSRKDANDRCCQGPGLRALAAWSSCRE
jgi:hypothetical protein